MHLEQLAAFVPVDRILDGYQPGVLLQRNPLPDDRGSHLQHLFDHAQERRLYRDVPRFKRRRHGFCFPVVLAYVPRVIGIGQVLPQEHFVCCPGKGFPSGFLVKDRRDCTVRGKADPQVPILEGAFSTDNPGSDPACLTFCQPDGCIPHRRYHRTGIDHRAGRASVKLVAFRVKGNIAAAARGWYARRRYAGRREHNNFLPLPRLGVNQYKNS